MNKSLPDAGLSPSKTLFFLCLSFIAGIGVQSVVKIPTLFMWGFLFVAPSIFIGAFLLRRSYLVVMGFCLLLFVVGVARLQIGQFAAGRDALLPYNDRPQTITVTGTVIAGPDIRDSSQKLRVNIDATDSVVLVTVRRYPEYRYLDRLRLVGKLKTPAEFEDFNYRDYLMKDGIYSVMDFPKSELVSRGEAANPAQWAYIKLLHFKQLLNASIMQNVAPPHSAILQGIMLGDTSQMPRELKEKFSATGLTHLTAISGSNVLILSAVLLSVLLFFGFWRQQAFVISLVFIWLYIAVAAFPTSGVRVGIMASIFLLAQQLGRQNNSSRAMVLAGAVMLAHNPLLLRYDVGFQLSFMAALGIIYLKPIISYPFSFIRHKKVREGIDIFCVTLAAQVFTLPIIAYYFKNISLVTLATNLLVIPAVDWIMAFGFLSAFAGIFSGFLGMVFAFPAWLLLEYFIMVMEFFYAPAFVVSIQHMPWILVVLYYIALRAAMAWYYKKAAMRFLDY